MYDLLHNNITWILQFHRLPFLSIQIQSEFRGPVFGVVVAIHEDTSDQILVALDKFQGVTIFQSFWESSNTGQILGKIFRFGDGVICSGIDELGIGGVEDAGFGIVIVCALSHATVNADETWKRSSMKFINIIFSSDN